MREYTKNKIELIFTIIGGIAIWLASLYVLVIMLWIALMLIEPKEIPREVNLLPEEEVYGTK